MVQIKLMVIGRHGLNTEGEGVTLVYADSTKGWIK